MKKYCALIIALIFVFLPLTNAFADFEWPIQINVDETGYEIEYQYPVIDFSMDDSNGGNYLYDLLEPIVSWVMNLESPFRYLVSIPLFPLMIFVPVPVYN